MKADSSHPGKGIRVKLRHRILRATALVRGLPAGLLLLAAPEHSRRAAEGENLATRRARLALVLGVVIRGWELMKGSGCRRGAGIAIAALLLASSARATTINFVQCVTLNIASDCAIGFDQISLDVTAETPDKVRFTFANSGIEMITLARIYFDDGSLMTIDSIDNSDTGVLFTQAFPGPNDLPGGENALPDPFVTTLGFLSGATAPPPTMGVEPGESVGIIFTLNTGQNFDDVIVELQNGVLRAGVHLINFTSGGSESLVTVPEPRTGVLLALGLGGLAALGRKRRRNA